MDHDLLNRHAPRMYQLLVETLKMLQVDFEQNQYFDATDLENQISELFALIEAQHDYQI
jgi:hypothetical protein